MRQKRINKNILVGIESEVSVFLGGDNVEQELRERAA